MTTKHFVIEPGNMSRYELLYTEYEHNHYGTAQCAITWLRSGTGGFTLTWTKGDNLWKSYSVEKSRIGEADLAPILRYVQRHFEGSIGELVDFEEYDENGIWRYTASA